jgi:hypothetical protein
MHVPANIARFIIVVVAVAAVVASRVLPAELGARVSRAAAEFWEDVVERESRADADAA